MSEIPQQAEWVYSAPNLKELAARYDQWAKDYDRDLTELFGKTTPQKIAKVFAKYVPTKSKILDVGVGTGLVGEFLNQHGYHHLDGLDISLKMMAEARKKNIYTAFYQEELGQPLRLETNSYQAVIAKGVFTAGHAPSSAFDELIRITVPAGMLVFSLRSDYYRTSNFREKQDALEATGHWKLVEKTDPFVIWPKATEEILCNIWVYRVTKF
ncbi:MAG: methyltransferase domain-containing protein [Spirulina sp. SIO3F2]|nr:methyltransferase domain-containing protein [Spirulina sp. SIO3F2]